MTSGERTHWIAERAHALGFDLCGVVALEPEINAPAVQPSESPCADFEELDRLPDWLARGYAGEMKYLHDPRRRDFRRVLEGARSLIVAAINYNSQHPSSIDMPISEGDDSPRGWISRYAWGDDYHAVIRDKLQALVTEMRVRFAVPFEARTYVDTGPIVERVAAKYAGLGWLAKNTCLIHPRLGSWLFLGVVVTTLVLEPTLGPGVAPPPDLCGSCRRCLDACPTDAFPEPYVLDARRCISYLTIELRGAIPEEVRSSMGSAVIGCDICQDVCPWNRKAPVTTLAAFQPREYVENHGSTNPAAAPPNSSDDSRISFLAPPLEWLASMSQQEFSAAFRRSAAKRAKWRGVVRNACVALGNSGISSGHAAYARVVGLLNDLAKSDDPLITEHARWALARISAR